MRSELARAANSGDKLAVDYLFDTYKCMALPGGMKISILDRSAWGGWAKVGAYIGDQAVVLWVPNAIVEE